MVSCCRSPVLAALASTSFHTYRASCWQFQAAPGPDEVIWKNLGMSYWQRSIRQITMWGLFVAIIIFYLPVTAIIQAPVNLDNARQIPGLSVLVDLPVVSQIIQGFLPSESVLRNMQCS